MSSLIQKIGFIILFFLIGFSIYSCESFNKYDRFSKNYSKSISDFTHWLDTLNLDTSYVVNHYLKLNQVEFRYVSPNADEKGDRFSIQKEIPIKYISIFSDMYLRDIIKLQHSNFYIFRPGEFDYDEAILVFKENNPIKWTTNVDSLKALLQKNKMHLVRIVNDQIIFCTWETGRNHY